VISLVNVTCEFEGQKALNNVTLSIQEGALIGLMGPGGCGKSTLCRVACGLQEPKMGAVVVDGVDLMRADRQKLQKVQRECGVQFQNDALFEHMTVLENVSYPLSRLTELSDLDMRMQAVEHIAMVGLAGFEEQFPNRLSGGQRRRVALARACVTKPKILICDDPTAGLDPVTSRKILDMIAGIRYQSKNTVVIVSSDVPGLLSVCETCALMWDGKVIAEGTPAEFKVNEKPQVLRFLKDARLPFGDSSW